MEFASFSTVARLAGFHDKTRQSVENEKIILKEIGHSSLRMTRRYTHFSPKQRRETAERLAI